MSPRRKLTPKRSRRFNTEDVGFVHKNYATMTAAEIAAERKLSLFQVNKIVAELRKAGIALPKKTPVRTNPVKAYVASIGGAAKAVRRARR